MTILANGNVGIGTTTPQYKLEISAPTVPTFGLSTQDTDILNGDYLGRIYFRGQDSANRVGALIEAGADADWSTTDPARAPTSLYFYTQTNTATDVIDGIKTPRLTINSAGNVGIGTTTPSQSLTVSGNARVTGALYDSNNSAGTAGYVLQSTGTGQQWVATSTLGFGTGTVDGNGSANRVAFWTDSNTLSQSPELSFIPGPTPLLDPTLTLIGDAAEFIITGSGGGASTLTLGPESISYGDGGGGLSISFSSNT